MFTFIGQREGETVIMAIRKHPIVYFKVMLVFVLTIILPLFLFLWLWFRQYPVPLYPERSALVGIFASLYFLYGLLFSCIAWINEEFDLFILTNDRLMDITQISLTSRSVSSTPLEHIQDAVSSVDGILPTLLNYGNVEVETAAGLATKIFIDRVPRPGEVAKAIMDAAHAVQKKVNDAKEGL